jgi:hypothetical protein
MPNSLEKFLRSNHCPYFQDPPVADEDIEFIVKFWTLCDFEDICLEKNCPLLPEERKLPMLKEEKT